MTRQRRSTIRHSGSAVLRQGWFMFTPPFFAYFYLYYVFLQKNCKTIPILIKKTLKNPTVAVYYGCQSFTAASPCVIINHCGYCPGRFICGAFFCCIERLLGCYPSGKSRKSLFCGAEALLCGHCCKNFNRRFLGTLIGQKYRCRYIWRQGNRP